MTKEEAATIKDGWNKLPVNECWNRNYMWWMLVIMRGIDGIDATKIVEEEFKKRITVEF